jgi:diguanylate cyclase (GGDEF)-like protein
MLDWDAFKLINDTLGHERADQMLGEFVPYFDKHFRRQGDTLAHERIYGPKESQDAPYLIGRYGGDEFAVVVDLDDRRRPDGLTPAQRMSNMKPHLLATTNGFVALQDQDVRDLKFNVSVGDSLWVPGSNLTVSNLFEMADMAMIEDKRSHGAPPR